jgi:hypothetical protein
MFNDETALHWISPLTFHLGFNALPAFVWLFLLSAFGLSGCLLPLLTLFMERSPTLNTLCFILIPYKKEMRREKKTGERENRKKEKERGA